MTPQNALFFILLLALPACSDPDDAIPKETPDLSNLTDAGTDIETDTDKTLIDVSEEPSNPNILLLIADDLGVDTMGFYPGGIATANTPNLDQLAATGVVYDKFWATPACTTTRASIITGLHGINSGVGFVPAVLPSSSYSIQAYLSDNAPTYKSAVFGKWHLGGAMPSNDHPSTFGIEHYDGNLAGTLDDYYTWEKSVNGVTEIVNEYHTTHVTTQTLNWINQQNSPWFAWVAYVAPHTPFHVPPETLHNRTLSPAPADISADPRPYFLAAVEAMDNEIGRLLDGMDAQTRANTIIIFIGDNGNPRSVIDRQVFRPAHGKNTLYEGGIRVPAIISGPGVREGARESGLANTTDLYATIAQLASDAPATIGDSQSLVPTMSKENSSTRKYNYVDFEGAMVTGWTTQNDTYKLISNEDGLELYHLQNDPFEATNLLPDTNYDTVVEELTDVADSIRNP